ncbi:hypothetical protein Dimus_013481 [Dionaea muscipula]
MFEAPNGQRTFICLLVGTPSEIVQQIEEGRVMTNDMKYLVLDDADTMFVEGGHSHDIDKIVNQLETHSLKSEHLELQIVLITSALTKVLGEQYTQQFEQDHAANVVAVLLEMD